MSFYCKWWDRPLEQVDEPQQVQCEIDGRSCVQCMEKEDAEESEDAELKPCPFCGSEVAFLGNSQSIKCKKCGCAYIVTNPLISRLEVAEAWNRRAEDGK